MMNDPQIISFERPLQPEEKADLIPLHLKDFEYVFAVQKEPIPPELGILKAFNSPSPEELEWASCTEVLDPDTIELSGKAMFEDENMQCLKPDKAITSKFYDLQGDGVE